MFVVFNRLLLIVAGAGLEPAWRCGILGFFTVLGFCRSTMLN